MLSTCNFKPVYALSICLSCNQTKLSYNYVFVGLYSVSHTFSLLQILITSGFNSKNFQKSDQSKKYYQSSVVNFNNGMRRKANVA